MFRIEINKHNQITIESNNVRLVSFNQMYIESVIKYYEKLMSNPINVKMYLNGQPWSKKQVEEYIKLKYQKWLDGDPYSSFAVFDSKTNEFIGTLNLLYQKNEFAFLGYKNVINIGIMIDTTYVSKRVGTEIANIAKQYILESLTAKPAISATKEILDREPPVGVIVTVHPDNKPSLNLIKHSFFGEPKHTDRMGKNQPRLVFFEALEKSDEKKPEPTELRSKL